MEEVLSWLLAAQEELEPQFKSLRATMSALKLAVRLTSAEKPDALPMQKSLTKLEVAAVSIDNKTLDAAIEAYAGATKRALDDLAFDFSKDLQEAFAQRGVTVGGRPPLITAGMLSFNINIAARKGQWFYGREPLTKLIPLTLIGIMKAYERQMKRIVNREIDTKKFVEELQKAWQDCLDKRDRNPAGGRINIIEVYSQLTFNRQSARFWNQPSRSTFKDYERAFFVRDLSLTRQQKEVAFRLGVATKNQAEQTSRSIWLPDSALDGQYYSDITFDGD